MALAALALVVFGAYDSYPRVITAQNQVDYECLFQRMAIEGRCPAGASVAIAGRRLASLVERAERLGVPVLTLAALPSATKLRSLTRPAGPTCGRPGRPKRSRRSRRSRPVEPDPPSPGSSAALLIASIALLVVVSGYSNGGGGPRIDGVVTEEPVQKVRRSADCFGVTRASLQGLAERRFCGVFHAL